MPKSQNNQRRRFINDISLHALLLRQGTITYDVADQPRTNSASKLDPNHLFFDNVSASLALEVSHISGLYFNLKRMKLNEQCGLSLDEMKGRGLLAADSLCIDNIHALFSKSLTEGSLSKLNLHGNLKLVQDNLSLRIQSLDLDTEPYSHVHAQLGLEMDIDSLNSLTYKACFLPSQLSSANLNGMAEEFGIPLSTQVHSWLEQIDLFQWDGELFGAADNKFNYQGHLSTTGKIGSRFFVGLDYQDAKTDPLYLSLNGTVDAFQYKDHNYRKISINGSYENHEIHSKFQCEDPLCNLKGYVDAELSGHSSKIKSIMSVQNLEPYKLHLTKISNLEDLHFNGIVKLNADIPSEINFDSKHFDISNIPNGYLSIDSLTIRDDSTRLNLGSLHMTIQNEQKTTVLALISNIGHIVCTPTSLIGYLPTYPGLYKMLKFPGELGDDVTFQSQWDSVRHQLSLSIDVPQWVTEGSTYSLFIKGNGETESNLPIPLKMRGDINFRYHNEKHDFSSDLALIYQPDPMVVELEPSTLSIDGKIFSTSDAVLQQLDHKGYQINHLHIQDNDTQNLEISGQFGGDKEMDMLVSLDNFQIDFFLDMLQKGYLDFGGYATGDIHFSSDPVYHLKTDSLRVDSFSYIGQELGCNYLSGGYDFEAGKLLLSAELQNYPDHHTHVDCEVRMHEDHDTLDLLFDIDSLSLDFVSYWIGGALPDLHGHGSGVVRLFGDTDSLSLIGTPIVHNANFVNNMLGTRFFISDTLYMTEDKQGIGTISLKNAKVQDKFGQSADLNFELTHHHLHNMEYGIDVNIPESNNGFLVYDHPVQEEGQYYWGQIWATGQCQIRGTYSHHRISLQATPAGKSVLNLSPGEENFTDNAYSFLTFRDKIQHQEEEASYHGSYSFKHTEEDEEPTYIEADLLIHANNRCQVYVLMDPLAEDRLICKGSGDLALHYDPHHDINLTGNYDISSGSYTVTMKGDVITKAFQLQQGSRITFPGSPSEAELDLKAVYNIPSANLKDLDESFSSLASLSRTTLPVDCKLNVTGPITAPQIAFDLEVKNTSDDVQALVHNIIGTQEMLNREVFYLLLFSKFYTPEYASTAQRQTGSELTSFASSSLTSQLNNLLGHMSDNFTLGTNFRSDKGDFSDMEMDVSVSTRLLNDRLLMTGNLGYRDAANSTSTTNTKSLIEDFDVEFLINTRGTVRAKAYSHYNDRDYSINNALTTQGIGIILRKDFNSFKDLLRRKKIKNANNK